MPQNSSASVLGIDAAWTAHNPSGVALAAKLETGWRLIAAAPSFAQFYGDPDAPDRFDAALLLNRARTLGGALPDLIAVDMPLAAELITSRRLSDNAISKRYAGRGAGTHSPSAARPGQLGLDLVLAFAQSGYPLHCQGLPTGPVVVEVYPHPALVELTGAERRLPYKIQKRAKYWPLHSTSQRLDAIFSQWALILSHLETVLPGTLDLLPLPEPTAPGRRLKAFEDTLDAVICTWIGICVLEGHAESFGDHQTAIWVPRVSATTRQDSR